MSRLRPSDVLIIVILVVLVISCTTVALIPSGAF